METGTREETRKGGAGGGGGGAGGGGGVGAGAGGGGGAEKAARERPLVYMVTGATAGIGLHTAGLLVRSGCTVVLHGR